MKGTIMTNSHFANRRQFLHTSMITSAAVAASTLPLATSAAVVKSDSNPDRDLKLGMASYSLRKFSLDEAIRMTKKLGLKYITLKSMHLEYDSTREQRREARAKIERAGLSLMGGGVVYMENNENDIQSFFEYAKDAGMPTIVCSPDPAGLDIVERMAKQYDIRIAIHNHGPGDDRYRSPLDILRVVKDRDERMGICMDVGHTVRIGEDPIDVIHKCSKRLYDFHLKDVTQAAARGSSTEVGKGVVDIVEVLKALVSLKYSYHLALEYEAHADAPMPGLIESVAYIRRILAALS